MRHYNIPVFIPELACPNQCVFCDQRKISGRNEPPPPSALHGIVCKYVSTFSAGSYRAEIAFFGGNFTGIPAAAQEAYLSQAQKLIGKGLVHGIRLSTRPDYICPQTVQRLKGYGVSCIELGAQSMHDSILQLAGRGHTAAQTLKAAELILGAGIELGLQMMLGLPGDSMELSTETARMIIAAGASSTRIYPVLVIEGTALADMYIAGNYKPLSLDEAAAWAKAAYLLFEEAGVKVLRTGLHPSADLVPGLSVIAGPYHHSFKEIMLTSIWADILKGLNLPAGRDCLIAVPEGQLNYAIGYKQLNRFMLQGMGISAKFRECRLQNKFSTNVSYS
jgi:histone acetyltransferase (RNA polymerase elongator complex component)